MWNEGKRNLGVGYQRRDSVTREGAKTNQLKVIRRRGYGEGTSSERTRGSNLIYTESIEEFLKEELWIMSIMTRSDELPRKSVQIPVPDSDKNE